MVVFNELRITDDYSKLIVDCSVEELDLYNSVYIESITLDYYKNVTSSGAPSNKAITIYNNNQPDNSIRGRRIYVSEDELKTHEDFGTDTFKGGMFFVTVTCAGLSNSSAATIAATMPCNVDNMVDIGIVMDWQHIYHTGMQQIEKAVSDCNNCESSSGFSHFVILWHALNYAIVTADYITLKKLWEKYCRTAVSKYTPVTGRTSGCGCHK